MPIALTFSIFEIRSNFQTNNRLVLLFVSTTEEFSTTPLNTPPRNTHTHTHKHKKRNHQSLYFLSHSSLISRRNFRTRKTTKANKLTLSRHSTFCFNHGVNFQTPHQQGVLLLFNSVGIFRVLAIVRVVLFSRFFSFYFLFRPHIKKANVCSSNQFFSSLCLLDGVVFCVNMPCFVFYFLFQLHRNFSTKPNIHSTFCLSSQKKKFRTNQLIFTFGSHPLTGIFKRRTVLLLFPHRKKEFRHKYRFSTFFVPLAFPKGIQTQKNIVFRLIRFRLNFFK